MDGKTIKVKETEAGLKLKLRECDRLWQRKVITCLLILKAEGFTSWSELRRKLKARLGSTSIVYTLQHWLERYQEGGLDLALSRDSKAFFKPGDIKERKVDLLKLFQEEEDIAIRPIIHAIYLVKSGGASSWADLSAILKSKYPDGGDFHPRIVRGWIERSKKIGAAGLMDVKRLGAAGISIRKLDKVDISDEGLEAALVKTKADPYYTKVILALIHLKQHQFLQAAAPGSGVSAPTLRNWRNSLNDAIASSKTESAAIEKFLGSLPAKGRRILRAGESY